MVSVRKTILILALAGVLHASGAGPKFFDDDPISSMPPPLPVGKPLDRDIDPMYEFLRQSRDPDPRPPTPAGAINTLGEVPNSEWFTNRHGLRRRSRDELQLGAGVDAPQPPFTIVDGKNEGITRGFTMEDAKGTRYFAKVDPVGHPELTTAAEVIASKFLYAIGYNTTKNIIVYLKLSDLRLSDTATIKLPEARSRKMAWNDVEEIVEDIQQQDGSFRVVASEAVEGEYIGPFRYEGTRLDDPNDITAHENRRDLRGLYVFSAWLNNTDPRAANTLDTVVEQNGIRFIRHYLIDFGSSLGSSGDRPKDATYGHEFVLPTPTQTLKRVFTLGMGSAPWERRSYPDVPGVGRFESKLFDPDSWKPLIPNPAFLSRLPDDDFWAAKQVIAFTDDDIRAIVETGEYSNARSAEYVIATLAKRRDKIGRTFFSKVLPVDHFRVEKDELLFDDLALKYGFHAARPYKVQWARFDNIRRTHDPIKGGESAHLPAEAGHASAGSYFCAIIGSPGEPYKAYVYVRKEKAGYKVVGIERTW